LSEPLVARVERRDDRDSGVNDLGTRRAYTWHDADPSRSSAHAHHRRADEEFLAQTRKNALSYAPDGVMGPWLARLGLRCVPVAASVPMAEGRVHRITRARDFDTSWLEIQMRRLAEARLQRGLSGRLTLTVVRHAQTIHNRNRRLAGAWFGADMGASHAGLEALHALDIPRGAVIMHSPLRRARETAEALAEMHQAAALLPIETGHEMCLGSFEGQRLDDLIQSNGSFQRLFVHGDALGAHPLAECLADLLVRVGFLIDEIVDLAAPLDLEDLHLVFVGHTMVNRALCILADRVFDEARGHYVCDGVDGTFPLMKNGTALTLFEG
jgi:broad specificity phosphatase PhoE